jgi:hypothetical protein
MIPSATVAAIGSQLHQSPVKDPHDIYSVAFASSIEGVFLHELWALACRLRSGGALTHDEALDWGSLIHTRIEPI